MKISSIQISTKLCPIKRQAGQKLNSLQPHIKNHNKAKGCKANLQAMLPLF